jgi:cytochrome P450
MVLAMIAVTSHDPKLWTSPSEFDPERFSRGEDKQAKGAFMPFGGGAHACIGAQLSTLEAKAFWHAMLRKCRFELRRPYDARHELVPLGIVSGDVGLALHPC